MSPVVPMPAFADPAHPEALGGSINFGVGKNFPDFKDHPMEHSADYAGGYLADAGERDEWTRAQWAKLAGDYDLAVGGSKQTIIDRVTAHEASLAEEGGES